MAGKNLHYAEIRKLPRFAFGRVGRVARVVEVNSKTLERGRGFYNTEDGEIYLRNLFRDNSAVWAQTGEGIYPGPGDRYNFATKTFSRGQFRE